jgi:hypothetical protein
VKVRHTLLIALIMTALLGVSTPSQGVVLPPQTASAISIATPHLVRPPVHVSRSTARSAILIPSVVRVFGRCVINHESRYAKPSPYRAQNPHSTASGAYQFINKTWRHYQTLAGFGGRYSRAKYAPPLVQDLVFAAAIKRGHYYHWRGTHCGHGT